jgi:hypothetical protein
MLYLKSTLFILVASKSGEREHHHVDVGNEKDPHFCFSAACLSSLFWRPKYFYINLRGWIVIFIIGMLS